MTLSQSKLKELITYLPETGEWFWRRSDLQSRKWNTRHAGKRAGWTCTNGYRWMEVQTVRYSAHRLAFLYMTGSIPPSDLEVDHIDGNRANNAWSNLRLATRTQNSVNTALRRDNTTGFKCVRRSATGTRWTSHLNVQGKQMHLGTFDTDFEAHMAYVVAARALHGDFSLTSGTRK